MFGTPKITSYSFSHSFFCLNNLNNNENEIKVIPIEIKFHFQFILPRKYFNSLVQVIFKNTFQKVKKLKTF